jgi:peroxiredoxin Q/BCP
MTDSSAMTDKVLVAGDPAPEAEMTLHTGEKVKLSSLKGKKVFLWFYPKDDTPG